MSELVTVAYDGAIAELEITDPQNDGATVGTVERGATIDVPKHVADDLVQREDFTKASAPETPEQKAKREKAEQEAAEEQAAADKAAKEAIAKVREARKENN